MWKQWLEIIQKNNDSIQCDATSPNTAIDYQPLITISVHFQSSSTIAINSQFLSFVPATATTNDYLFDIFIKDFTADQSGVQIAAINTFFSGNYRILSLSIYLLKTIEEEIWEKSELRGFNQYLSMWSRVISLRSTIFSISVFKTIYIRTYWDERCSRCFFSLNLFLGIHIFADIGQIHIESAQHLSLLMVVICFQ